MYEKEEDKLNDFKKAYDDISTPLDALDNAISSGFQQAKSAKQKPRKMKWIMSVAMVAIIVITFVTSIRVSPVFAQYVTSIPGMEKIVELIREDKGMMSAVKNDYYQEIAVSKEKDGLEVVIDGAIADENGIVLFYTLNTDKKQKEISIGETHLESSSGEVLDLSSVSFGMPHNSEEGKKTYSGTIEYFFEKPFKSREFEIDLKITGDSFNEEFSFPFKIKEDIREKKTFELNKDVTVEGQNMTILDATVYPLRVAVHVKMDPGNTKKILAFEDMRLVDERGETWGKTNGVVGSEIAENEEIIYLQSNYFHDPERLYLVFSRMQAIDKDKRKLVVDTEEEVILNQPNGNKLRNLEINGNRVSLSLHTEKRFSYFMFGKMSDNTGKEVTTERSFTYGYRPDKGMAEIGFNMKGSDQLKSPISIELEFFPNWITGDEKVRIK
ncbi:protein of unknown function [Virgibacillus subterraneus]|uniref:DUF4179 domain-containing protein n=2 Tax=Virgibacillus TaxID=84406 RepID=A0A1H0ZGC4_9BACI|nr:MULTISPECIES: DUF4179 domain-containing protein [Virgibacillus]SDQ26565.1 protein of unknown function [Virgibacillus salinus]SEP92694.1 protein of unknown function [Virgibacillus subterraneus]